MGFFVAMLRYSKTFSIFFLGIFSMFLLHQVLPHVHHEHDQLSASASQSHHHHDHEKKVPDHNDQEENEGDFDFFGFILSNHAHSAQVETTLTIKNATGQQVLAKDAIHYHVADLAQFFLFAPDLGKFYLSHAPPNFPDSVFLSNSFLRGPPSLG